ncbi:hypothetical protein BGX31_001571 [Mortierella sp. GBA43]|nr:hypothetical protein BGX31_001571 [Mortierella sp. GBA43]
MDNPSPLEIPEIVTIIGRSLKLGDLARGMRVPKVEAIRNHRLLVKEFHIIDTHAWRHYRDVVFECSNLTSLQVCNDGFDMGPGTTIWGRAHGLQRLTRLEAYNIKIRELTEPVFWELCIRLEHLSMDRMSIHAPPDRSLVFERIQHLYLSSYFSFGFGWIRQCPNLATLYCDIDFYSKDIVDSLTECVTSGPFPKLHGLKLVGEVVVDEQLAGMISGMHQATVIITPECSYGPLSFAALRRHIPFLRFVDVHGTHKDIASAVAIELLSSCPQLEYLVCEDLKSQDVLKSLPWVCAGSLKAFQAILYITKDEDEIRQQGRCLEKISQLVNLEHLNISVFLEINETDPPLGQGMGEGLKHLASLRKLERLNLRGLEVTAQEVQWMINNLKSLKFVGGTLSWTNDRTLSRMFQDAGITYTCWKMSHLIGDPVFADHWITDEDD